MLQGGPAGLCSKQDGAAQVFLLDFGNSKRKQELQCQEEWEAECEQERRELSKILHKAGVVGAEPVGSA